MDINPEKVIEVGGIYSVKDAVANYVEFYWAKEFNLGVEQFKKIQNEPNNKIKYLDIAINHLVMQLLSNLQIQIHITLANANGQRG